MKVGFTGTRYGMTVRQADAVRFWLMRLCGDLDWDTDIFAIFRHGLCKGADAQAHVLAKTLGYAIHGHPSTLASRDLTLPEADFVTLADPKEPIERDKDIVDACDVLIAATRQRAEEQRSGTWATVRYARKIGRTTIMVWP